MLWESFCISKASVSGFSYKASILFGVEKFSPTTRGGGDSTQ